MSIFINSIQLEGNIVKLEGTRTVYCVDIAKVLGSGSLGRVFKAWDEKNPNDFYALKEIVISHGPDKGLIQNYCEQEINELRDISKENSPNIVKFFEKIKNDNKIYLVMELCDGRDLFQFLQDKSNLNTDEIIFLFHQIIEGMKVLQRVKKVHRDIKPGNILVNNGVLKIADFQFVKQETEANTLLVGTPSFMAPEMMAEDVDDQAKQDKADIFSLGVLLYWMAFRKTPWEENISKEGKLINFITVRKEKQKQLDKKIPDLWFPEGIIIDGEIKNLILQMLKYSPNDRISWEELFKTTEMLKEKKMVDINIRISLKHKKPDNSGSETSSSPKIKLPQISSENERTLNLHEKKEMEKKIFEKSLGDLEKETYSYIFIYNSIMKIANLKSQLNFPLELYYNLITHLAWMAYIRSFYLAKTLESQNSNVYQFPNENWEVFLKYRTNCHRFRNLLGKVKKDSQNNKNNLEQVLQTTKPHLNLILKNKIRLDSEPKITKLMFLDFKKTLIEALLKMEKMLKELRELDNSLLFLAEDLFLLMTMKSSFDWDKFEDFNLASFYEKRHKMPKDKMQSQVNKYFAELRDWVD